MEQASHANSSSTNIFIKNAVVFENELKERLNWSKQQWSVVGESGTKLHKLSNSLNYWKVRLKPAVEETSIVITLFNREKDVRVEMFEIISEIEKLDESFIVKGIASFRNPRYICLYFQNKEVRDRVKETFRLLDNNYVVYMSWALDNESSVSTLKVHWLPMTFDINKIKEDLAKYVDCVEHERKNLVFMSGRDMPSGKVEFKVKFKKGVTADSVPHVMDIGKMEALITIRGRQNLCLNCDALGHISKECKLRFCAGCHELKPKQHDCVLKPKTYANILKANTAGDIGADLKEWGDETVIIENSPKCALKAILNDRIETLENKIKATQLAQYSIVQRSDEKKRKAVDQVQDAPDVEIPTSSVDDSMEEDQDSGDNGEEQSYLESEEGKSGVEQKLEDNGAEGVQIKKANKKLRKKKNKGKNTTPDELGKLKENLKKTETLGPVLNLRSYGKPIRNNSRILKQEAKFNKIAEVREFVFQD